VSWQYFYYLAELTQNGFTLQLENPTIPFDVLVNAYDLDRQVTRLLSRQLSLYLGKEIPSMSQACPECDGVDGDHDDDCTLEDQGEDDG